MTIMQIRYFIEVCKDNNITRAAETLHISQPSISNAMRDLENELGVNLFHRARKRLSLTHEGAYFQQKAIKLLEQFDFLSENMRDLGKRRNKIRIGVPPMIGTFLFPQIFDIFNSTNPTVFFEMVEHGSLRIHQMVMDEELDIALAILKETRDEHINNIDLLKTQLYYFVDQKHAFARLSSVSFKQLENEPVILFKNGSYQNDIILDRFRQNNANCNAILYSSQLYTIKQVIARGKAGAFLFREIAELDHDLVGIPLVEPIELGIALIWKRDRHIYSDTAQFIDVVKQHFMLN